MSERINNRMKPSNDKGDHHVVQAVGPSACRTRYIMGAPNMPVAVAMGRMSAPIGTKANNGTMAAFALSLRSEGRRRDIGRLMQHVSIRT